MSSIDVNSLTPDIIERFRTAIELGKWPDGTKLTAEHRETCMQAVIMFDYQHKADGERVGDVRAKDCSTKPAADEQIATLKWQSDNQEDS